MLVKFNSHHIYINDIIQSIYYYHSRVELSARDGCLWPKFNGMSTMQKSQLFVSWSIFDLISLEKLLRTRFLLCCAFFFFFKSRELDYMQIIRCFVHILCNWTDWIHDNRIFDSPEKEEWFGLFFATEITNENFCQ